MVAKGEHVRPDLREIDVDMPAMLKQAVAAMDAIPASDGKARGIAVAATDPANIPLASCFVRLKVDGSVLVVTSTIEMGQGAHGVLRAVAANALAQPVDRIHIAQPDTDTAPYDWATGASRSTVMMGLAVEEACTDIQRQVRELAAEMLGGEPQAYSFVDNGVAGPLGTTSFRELIIRAHGMDSGEFIGVGRITPRSRGGALAKSPLFWETSVGVGEVDIDTDTGALRLARYVSAADVGRVMNRKAAEGQDEGAAIQALGHSLWEEYVYEDGQPINASMIDYHVPAMDETPRDFVTLLVESGDGPGPGGARGMGEGAILPVAPVIANALARRYGARVRDLPLTPERVWRALRDAKDKGGK
jgi:CO/xanthine dehydrogenase Mo-binding subunit